MTADGLLNTREAAFRLKVPEDYLRHQVERGKIRSVKEGRFCYFRPDDLDRWRADMPVTALAKLKSDSGPGRVRTRQIRVSLELAYADTRKGYTVPVLCDFLMLAHAEETDDAVKARALRIARTALTHPQLFGKVFTGFYEVTRIAETKGDTLVRTIYNKPK